MRFYYSLHTLDPIVLTEQATATLQHTSLDFISGHTLLGALAAQQYTRLSPEISWTLFHSGKVRFSPAYLVHQQQVCLPTPLCWQKPKKSLQAEEVSNSLYSDFQTDNKLWQPLSKPYVCASGDYPQPKMQRITRTALDDKKGTAKEGQLYSYNAIEAGQTFLFWIETDDKEAQATFIDILADSMKLRIGRSRSTEYGGVQLQSIQDANFAENWLQPSTEPSKQLVLWCLADAECYTQEGAPTYTPALADISELQGQLNPQKSQIKTKRIRRFNQKRQGFDGEQLLISKGSVLVYDLKQPLKQDALQKLQRQGLGVNQQQGLGWISVNPAWLSYEKIDARSLEPIGITLPCMKQPMMDSTVLEVQEDTPLMRWVQAQAKADQTRQQDIKDKDKLIQAVFACYNNARSFKGVLHAQPYGVSKTQWGKMKEAVDNLSPESWHSALFNTEKGICNVNTDTNGWGCSWLDEDNKPVTFAEAFKKQLNIYSKNRKQYILQRFCESIINYDLSDYDDLKKAEKDLVQSNSAKKELTHA
tara:strand:+ start:2303 stop:3898 length:1596 start_codon:yes stop_codon:yes gene_type:complete